jgi:N-acetyl-gamma-glutamyl-phosphate reductase
VLKHRHQPEIDTYAGVETVFTPHLGNFDRGILSTIHVELAQGWTADKVRALYETTYANERFVRLCAPGVFPAVADVRGSNFCDFGWALDEKHGHLIIASAIDNLVKGAAGQAVQAMNARFGLDEGLGLLDGSLK